MSYVIVVVEALTQTVGEEVISGSYFTLLRQDVKDGSSHSSLCTFGFSGSPCRNFNNFGLKLPYQ